jgi:group II intron reverse transcriptase/maturase
MTLHREQLERETKFARIAKKAQANPEETFTSLSHYLSEEFLISSFRKLRKSAVSGIDGKTWGDYEFNLLVNIESLHQQLRSWEYKAPDIRRTWIDKGGGKKRPLGISTIEDKIVQRAVVDILNNIYDQDFYDFSYGFRRKRSAHQALKQVHSGCMNRRIRFVLDADIQGCFDNFDHQVLRELLAKRVKDKWILRLINQWLKVGIVDGETMHLNQQGTPQGNIISPLLCNIYLHYVLDEWMMQLVKPLLKGEMFIVRYADDFVIGFEYFEDAQKVMSTLPKRMAKYGLNIHPDKTKLVEFTPDGKGKPPTIDFLGFTHYWTKSFRGVPVVKRRTTCKGLRKGIKKLEDSCKFNRHKRLKEQYKVLKSKLHGLYQYYGIRSNFQALKSFYRTALQRWYYWLNKRSQTNSYTWEGYKALLKHFTLPKPRIVHINV